jgi:D-beta-D-heptose 7-phosphate kinase/D-beta-D-heptose 1-phosphate adenosyltransferase
MSNILVIGDIMIDKYIYTNISKLANESPIPVFSYSNEKYILGGAGNVVENMKLFQNNLFLLTVVGQDDNKNIVEDLTNKFNTTLIIDNTRKTTVKTRMICDNKILFRYDTENTHSISTDIETQIINSFNGLLPKIDIVLFSDYNKGVLTEKICKYIIEQCNLNNKVTIGDLKYNFSYFKNITITKPNFSEAKQFSKKNAVIEMHNTIINEINCKYSIITLGKDGISLFDRKNLFQTSYESNEVIDVTGAGDIVAAVVSSFYNKTDIKSALKIATYLGTLSVKKIGTYEISHNDILSAYKWIKNKEFNQEMLYHLKNSNNKIVFTNGCFDVLHIGHLTYLEEAKKLGDILILGLNSDNSIKRLKGDKRPINNLQDRITFLNKLDFIDFIIPFDEDTPIEIIKLIQPDILVKGGDYTIESIVGREFAKETIILPFVDGKSSTNIINRLKDLS